MSAQEFGEWTVMLRNEQLHPAADGLRHAQLLAAVHNGAMTRKGNAKKPFEAREFMAPDPWVQAAPEQRAAVNVSAQVAHINALIRKDRRP